MEVQNTSQESGKPAPSPFQAASEDAVQAPAPEGQAVYPHEDDARVVIWTASEFIAHEKSANWYVILGIAAIIVATLTFIITKDKVATAAIVIVAAVFGYYASRKPRELQYRVDDSGITIGGRHFDYGHFRSFAIIDDGAFSSIVFTPLKRLATWLVIYYDPADEEKIVSIVSDALPIENRQHDIVERFMRKIRF